MIDPPRVPFGMTATHVYTAIIKPNNNYEILVDKKVEKSGSMKTDFDPPFTPPKEIDDENDFKPENWYENLEIEKS